MPVHIRLHNYQPYICAKFVNGYGIAEIKVVVIVNVNFVATQGSPMCSTCLLYTNIATQYRENYPYTSNAYALRMCGSWISLSLQVIR